MVERITPKQFQEADDVADWRVLAFGASAWFATPSHAAGAGLVRKIGELADAANHHPDVDLRRTGVHVRLPDARPAWTERSRRGPRGENFRGGPRAGPGG
jgi:pterin-4a-carbinolamine dehydratase